MANPQWEEGFVKVATEIWDSLCHARIPGEARQVLDAVIRKTYGFNKKTDVISLSQFVKMTGLSNRSVRRAINRLLAMNMLRKKAHRGRTTYSLEKDYEKWVLCAKKRTMRFFDRGGAHFCPPAMREKAQHNRHYTKDTNTKDKPYARANENVDNSLQTFAQWKTENTVALDRWRFEYDRMFGVGWVDSYVDDIPARIREGLVIRDYLRYVKSMLRSASEEGKWGQKGLRSPMTAEQERAHYGEHDARTGQTHSNGEPESMADIISRVTDGTES